jgi:hypothetical protein
MRIDILLLTLRAACALQLGLYLSSWTGHLTALLTCATPEVDGRVRGLWEPLWAATVRQARKFDAVSDIIYVRLLADQVRPGHL